MVTFGKNIFVVVTNITICAHIFGRIDIYQFDCVTTQLCSNADVHWLFHIMGKSHREYDNYHFSCGIPQNHNCVQMLIITGDFNTL